MGDKWPYFESFKLEGIYCSAFAAGIGIVGGTLTSFKVPVLRNIITSNSITITGNIGCGSCC